MLAYWFCRLGSRADGPVAVMILPLSDVAIFYKAASNPYTLQHGPQLHAVLKNAYMNIERRHCHVDQDGVSGGIAVWKDADTEEHWKSYWVAMGPGSFW